MENFNPKGLKSVKLDTTEGQHGFMHGNLARFDYSVESRETKNFSPIILNFFFNLLWIETWPETASQELHYSHFRVVKTHSEIIERGSQVFPLWSVESL